MTDPTAPEPQETPADPPPSPRDGGGQGFIVDEATDEIMRLRLDAFEGPFEVLLYLIRAQEIDIFDIPIATITAQYLRFLEMMREENLDVAGDFLVMAATLIQIKSRMLIPAETEEEEDEEYEEEDPRFELVEKLLEYRKYRDVVERLERLEQERREWFTRKAKPPAEATAPDPDEEDYIEVSLYDLMKAFKGVLRFLSDDVFHDVAREHHSIDEKIALIEEALAQDGSVAWTDLFRDCKSRIELVCCFLAILELCRMGRVRAHQHRLFEDIRLFPVDAPPPATGEPLMNSGEPGEPVEAAPEPQETPEMSGEAAGEPAPIPVEPADAPDDAQSDPGETASEPAYEPVDTPEASMEIAGESAEPLDETPEVQDESTETSCEAEDDGDDAAEAAERSGEPEEEAFDGSTPDPSVPASAAPG